MLARSAFRNVARNPRRTLAVMIAVALGVWSLLFLRAFNAGALERLREVTIHARHGHGEVAKRGYFGEVYDKPQEHWIDRGADVEAKLRAIPGVQATFPRVSFPALVTNGRVSIGALGQGVDAVRESAFFNALNVEQGASLTGETDGVMLGRGLAASLGVKPGDVVTVLGSTVNGTTNSTELVVTGIFHTGAPDFDDRVFRMQLAQAQAFLDTDRVESIALALTDDRDAAWPPVAAAISAAMPDLEAKSFAQLDEVNYGHMRAWVLSQAGVFDAIIGMLVFFGVLNTVAAGVLDRRQEIGTLRANGESRFEVLQLLALESMVVAVAGALAGIAIHLLVAHVLLAKGVMLPAPAGQTRALLVLLRTDPAALASVASSAIAITVAGAVIASIRAVRTPVAEALRSL
jgi:putative ABC transport system permease protein